MEGDEPYLPVPITRPFPAIETDPEYAPFINAAQAGDYARGWSAVDGRRRRVQLRLLPLAIVSGRAYRRWTVIPGPEYPR